MRFYNSIFVSQYLDAPDRKGDLLYIQKLVAVIEAFGDESYLPIILKGTS